MAKKVLQLKNINLVYNPSQSNEFQALRDIDLEVMEGDFAVVLGPSGCGKSSLLNIIAGLEVPSEGSAVINGENILEMSSRQRVDYHRREVGMIFQAYNLISTLTVLDNVALPQMFINKRKRKRDKKALEILSKLGIKNHAQKIPTELSGGQQQRIGIARAIVNEPRLILADEPVGNLDSVSSNNVMEILNKLNSREGKTVIMVTHNPEHAKWGNRVVKMRDGKITHVEVRDKEGVVEKKEEREEKTSEYERIINRFKGLTENQIKTLMNPLKAKKIIDFLIMPYDKDQTDAVEDNIKRRLTKRLSAEQFRKALDVSREQGGSGLDSRTAEKFTRQVEYLLNAAKQVYETPDKRQKADLIMNYIKNTEGFNLTEKDMKMAAKVIFQKLSGRIDHKQMKERLDLSSEEGGAGLDKRIVPRVLSKIDLVLIVGYGFEQKKPLPRSKS